jgi:hypothetical protein
VRWTLDGLKQKPDLAIVALGANDMLRGIRPEQTREDLDAILAEFKKRDIPVAGRRHARCAQSGPRLHGEVQLHLPGPCAQVPGAALPRSSSPEWRATRP